MQPSVLRVRDHGKFAVSLAPGAITFTRSSLDAWQSFDEKMRSEPLVTRNSICEVPMLTSQGTVPPLVTFKVSMGFSPAPYAGLSVEAATVTRFGLQAGVAEGVGDGVAEGVAEADAEGVAADGLAEAEGAAGAAELLWVDDACSEPALKAPAVANPLTTSAITSRSAPPATSRRRRYTAALGFRTLLEPDALRVDESPCLPILLG